MSFFQLKKTRPLFAHQKFYTYAPSVPLVLDENILFTLLGSNQRPLGYEPRDLTS